MPPRNVTVSLDPSGMTYVHWNEPVGADYSLIGYELRYMKIGIGNCDDRSTGFPITRTVEASTTSYSMYGLEDWTRYHIEVRSFNQAGSSSPSESVYITSEVGKRISIYFISIEYCSNSKE